MDKLSGVIWLVFLLAVGYGIMYSLVKKATFDALVEYENFKQNQSKEKGFQNNIKNEKA